MRSFNDRTLPAGLKRFWSRLQSLGQKERPKVLFEGDSPFHHVTISQYGDIRTMHLGPEAEEAETSMKVSDPCFPVFEYPGMMMIALALGQNKRILMLGLGGGFIPGLFQRILNDHHLTVVELDPLVAELAGVWFGFQPGQNVELVIGDGFEHVEQAPPLHYDQIWLDAFSGDYIPERLAGSGFLRLCREKLSEGGVVVQNLHQTSRTYKRQLRHTFEIFGAEPLLLGGIRSANTVAISLVSDEPQDPFETGDLLLKIKAFRSKVGPYDLVDELRKAFREPSFLFESYLESD
ncbi:MAG: fused MFS/spermidine synthase [Deltaproteobacteria bacterium]|jgi:spermidine synthase|nr:fused MFS/spermidine synthase [Deltaproteobacteria bacterium]